MDGSSFTRQCADNDIVVPDAAAKLESMDREDTIEIHDVFLSTPKTTTAHPPLKPSPRVDENDGFCVCMCFFFSTPRARVTILLAVEGNVQGYRISEGGKRHRVEFVFTI